LKFKTVFAITPCSWPFLIHNVTPGRVVLGRRLAMNIDIQLFHQGKHRKAAL